MIYEVTENKKRFLPLLLLGDEQESMIDRYLGRGRLYVLEETEVIGVCVVTEEGDGIAEIKNLAVSPAFQRQGCGRRLMDFVADAYGADHALLQVGTGDSPATVPFYEKCGFRRSHVLPNFFLENYDHPIFERGVQLVDMIYLRRRLASAPPRCYDR